MMDDLRMRGGCEVGINPGLKYETISNFSCRVPMLPRKSQGVTKLQQSQVESPRDWSANQPGSPVCTLHEKLLRNDVE